MFAACCSGAPTAGMFGNGRLGCGAGASPVCATSGRRAIYPASAVAVDIGVGEGIDRVIERIVRGIARQTASGRKQSVSRGSLVDIVGDGARAEQNVPP